MFPGPFGRSRARATSTVDNVRDCRGERQAGDTESATSSAAVRFPKPVIRNP